MPRTYSGQSSVDDRHGVNYQYQVKEITLVEGLGYARCNKPLATCWSYTHISAFYVSNCGRGVTYQGEPSRCSNNQSPDMLKEVMIGNPWHRDSWKTLILYRCKVRQDVFMLHLSKVTDFLGRVGTKMCSIRFNDKPARLYLCPSSTKESERS